MLGPGVDMDLFRFHHLEPWKMILGRKHVGVALLRQEMAAIKTNRFGTDALSLQLFRF